MTNDIQTVSPTPLQRSYPPLVGLTSLAILFHAVTAGQFMARRGQESWVDAHDMTGYVTLLLAIATAVVAVVAFRQDAPVVWGSVALAVLVAIQLVIGHLISDLEQRVWVGLHVPLALVVFGLTAWLALRAAGLRRNRSR